eukprot:7386800-Prymnesium_polylepis.1
MARVPIAAVGRSAAFCDDGAMRVYRVEEDVHQPARRACSHRLEGGAYPAPVHIQLRVRRVEGVVFDEQIE